MPLRPLLLASLSLISTASFATVPAYATEPAMMVAAYQGDGAGQRALAGQQVIGPDLHALRYFAERGEQEKYMQELARLRISYPGFQPPANLLSPTYNPDQALWDLFSAGKLDELEAEIAKRQAAQPYWQADDELLAKIREARSRTALLSAYQSYQYGAVKEIANSNPALIKPDDPEALWAVAESLCHEQKWDAAVELFDAMLARFADPGLVATSLQKAGQHLPAGDASWLYHRVIARLGTAGTGGLRPGGETDPASLYGVAFARGLALRATSFGLGYPANHGPLLEAFGAAALRDKQADDLALLAWASYLGGDYERSRHWFSQIDEHNADLKSLEGHILSLQHLGQLSEAQRLADRWKDKGDAIARLYLSVFAPTLLDPKAPALKQEFLLDYARLSKAQRSGEGAEALGWYAFNLKQYKTAADWFNTAIGWQVTETAVYGRVLTASMMGDKKTFSQLQAQYGPDYKRIAELAFKDRASTRAASSVPRVTLASRLAKAHKTGRYQTCLELSDRMIAARHANAQTHQTRGWCLMQLNRPTEAQLAFETAMRMGGSTKATRTSGYGAGLAALRRGKSTEASQIARLSGLDGEQLRVIDKGVLAQQAVEAFRQKRYRDSLVILNQRASLASEPRNLSEMRAWSLYHLGDYHNAHRLFVALNSVMSTKSIRDGVRAAQRKIHPSVRMN